MPGPSLVLWAAMIWKDQTGQFSIQMPSHLRLLLAILLPSGAEGASSDRETFAIG